MTSGTTSQTTDNRGLNSRYILYKHIEICIVDIPLETESDIMSNPQYSEP